MMGTHRPRQGQLVGGWAARGCPVHLRAARACAPPSTVGATVGDPGAARDSLRDSLSDSLRDSLSDSLLVPAPPPIPAAARSSRAHRAGASLRPRGDWCAGRRSWPQAGRADEPSPAHCISGRLPQRF